MEAHPLRLSSTAPAPYSQSSAAESAETVSSSPACCCCCRAPIQIYQTSIAGQYQTCMTDIYIRLLCAHLLRHRAVRAHSIPQAVYERFQCVVGLVRACDLCARKTSIILAQNMHD